MRRPSLLRAALPFVLPAALLSALWGGCSKEEAPAPPPVVKKTAPAPRPAPALPGSAQPAVAATGAATPAPEPTFSPVGKRDPFLPYIKGDLKTVRAERLEDAPPLQRYEVLEFKLVGVIWGPRGYRALIEDRDRKGYTVSLGTKIGRGNGTVVRITQNELVVKEVISDNRGKGLAREISLKLQSAGGK